MGFFLISKPSSRHTFSNARNYPHPPDFLVHLAGSGRRVYVKGRYEGIVRTAYPELKVISAENVEDAVLAAEPGSVGLEIVQTGNTLKRKGLLLHGEPLFLSESVYVVDYQRYLNNERLRHFIQSINPMGYFAEERIPPICPLVCGVGSQPGGKLASQTTDHRAFLR